MRPTQRLGHYQCLQRILSSEGQLSPVWSIPFMTTEALRKDWLHVSDQDVTPVFLGGLFAVVLGDKEVGRNQEERCPWLWQEIQQFYNDNGVVDKFNNLVKTMIIPKKGSIQLTGSGAEVRALVPYGLQLVNSWGPDGMTPERFAARSCMRELSACYSSLSTDASTNAAGSLLDHALAFQANLQGLHRLSPRTWQLRPKLHMFLELAAEGSNPAGQRLPEFSEVRSQERPH